MNIRSKFNIPEMVKSIFLLPTQRGIKLCSFTIRFYIALQVHCNVKQLLLSMSRSQLEGIDSLSLPSAMKGELDVQDH